MCLGTEGRNLRIQYCICSQGNLNLSPLRGWWPSRCTYLCCRKPWVPSGPAGCRTVWLFDLVSSEGSVELLCPGLAKREREKKKRRQDKLETEQQPFPRANSLTQNAHSSLPVFVLNGRPSLELSYLYNSCSCHARQVPVHDFTVLS